MKRQRWSKSFGDYGRMVSVFEEKNGRLYGRVHGKKKALGRHFTRETAVPWMHSTWQKLYNHETTIADPTPTVAKVFGMYLAEVDEELSAATHYENKRASAMWTQVLGANCHLAQLTLQQWTRFTKARGRGEIDAQGRPVEDAAKRRRVGPRTVEADCEWLFKVCNWATTWRVGEPPRPLLRENPLKWQEFRDTTPQEKSPRRPWRTHDEYEAILAVADQVHPYLKPVLRIINGTMRRIDAILQLRAPDFEAARYAQAPKGRLVFPAASDKTDKRRVAVLDEDTRAALDEWLRVHPVIGNAYLFPAPRNPGKPVDYWYMSKMLRKAERLAGVPKQDGTLWHAYCRKFATERRHVPLLDAAAAGGRSPQTMQLIYQQVPDDGAMYEAVSSPRRTRRLAGS